MKRCILEFDDERGTPTLKSMYGETLAICTAWSMTRDTSRFMHGSSAYTEPAQIAMSFSMAEDFFSKLQTVETQNVEPIVNIQTEQFEHRAIEVS